ncbi:ABC-type uncharacterized transport system involved in gliding motility, auxiliary component [Beggiatoa alba B18LD]|uniref:ABC-type uncharacterized transport system involved in gliding motility, auxiliary component n=1 Tax=Beggiatoa alba B18LD TaxID=395493 RepID=I3CG40_9GAMM|nr:Gldg family protein [Beggiatoa alba]EIJ42583.1 ABC-type uncharacterized transport system involved in gliding motility, auxiliary component [Beggiatoa alba B18LD]
MNKLLTTTGLLLGLALLIAVNITSNTALKSARLDFTANQLYTLSQGSKNIINSLQEPITLRFYLSEKLATNLPSLNSYTIRVRELLEEYQRLSMGKINLQLIDPEPFTEEEDRAVGYGLQGVPITDDTLFYFGLVGTNAIGTEEVISFFQPNRAELLEYDLTQIIYRLANPKQKVIGLMSSLPMQGSRMPAFLQRGGAEPWMIYEQISKLFEVRPLEMTVDSIPADIDVLMLVHPKNLSDATLYALDQFVLRGGRLLAFIDPFSEVETPQNDPNNPMAAMQQARNSALPRLLDNWGVELVESKVVGDLSLAKKVQAARGGRPIIIDYPVWIDLNTPNFNSDDVITAKLDMITFASTGILKKKEGAQTQITPLIETSDKAMQIDSAQLQFMSDPTSLVQNFKSEGKFTLAVRITGKVKTAFPDGKPHVEKKAEDPAQPEAEKKDDKPVEQLTESKDSINVIVVADTDLLDDQMWVRVQNFLGQRVAMPLAANGSFVTNALDNLSGSNDLISVRNRGSFARPFTRVEALKQEAEAQFSQKAKELQARLEDTEAQLRKLQDQRQDGNKLVLTAEQQQEVERFRAEKVKIRKELRDVQHELQKNIEGLEAGLKFINIAFVPFLVGFAGIFFGVYRLRRRQQLKR